MEIKDITGQFFGEIEVIGDTGERGSKGGVRWLCRCSCGREFFYESWFLKRRTHCGCKSKRGRRSSLSEDERKERKRLQGRRYYEKNKDRKREYNLKNKKKLAARQRKRYRENIEAERARVRDYKKRIKNTDKEIRAKAVEALTANSVLNRTDLPEALIETKMNQIKLNRILLGRME